MSSKFKYTLNRLKIAVGLSKDGEIAELIGLSITAFAERKRRDSIPIKEILQLVKNRPELNLDLNWILDVSEFKQVETSPRKLEDCLTLDGMMAATEKHAKYFFADLGFSESEVEMVVVMLKNHDQIPLIRFGKFTCLLPYDMPDGRERLLNKVCDTCGSTHKKLKEQA